MNAVPILYTKRGCQFCREAMAFFSTHGVEVEVHDVDLNYSDMKRLVEASGQSNVPTFEYEDFIIADFTIDELMDELAERPDIRQRLGLGLHDDET